MCNSLCPEAAMAIWGRIALNSPSLKTPELWTGKITHTQHHLGVMDICFAMLAAHWHYVTSWE